MMMKAITFVALLALLAPANAYPSLWAGEYATAPSNCAKHPSTKKDGHGAPTPDSAIKFAVADAAGRPVTALCPGAAVTVTVSFPAPRLAFLTASAGTFAKGGKGCAAHVVMDRTKGYAPAAKQAAAMTVPCSATAPITLKVTSAAGSNASFRTATATLPVNPRCKVATCSG